MSVITRTPFHGAFHRAASHKPWRVRAIWPRALPVAVIAVKRELPDIFGFLLIALFGVAIMAVRFWAWTPSLRPW